MAVSIFLGGFGNKSDAAALDTAFDLYKSDVNGCFAPDPAVIRSGERFAFFFADPMDIFRRYARIDKVVVTGGGFDNTAALRDVLDGAMRCKQRGAAVYVHDIVIGGIGKEWGVQWPYLLPILQDAAAFTVRDQRSKDEVESWGFGLHPTVCDHPAEEAQDEPTPALAPIASDAKFADRIPQGQDYIGISISNRDRLWDVISQNYEQIHSVLRNFGDAKILPVVSTIVSHDPEARDDEGFRRFAKMFGLEGRVVFPEAADPAFWRENVGPGDTQYIVSRCSQLISACEKDITQAIAAKVPFIALFEYQNPAITRIYQKRYRELAEGSSLFPLYPM